MAIFHYTATELPANSPWSRLPPERRSRFAWALWAVTWLGLAAGCVDARYWSWVVGFSIAHALFVLRMVNFRPLVFPAQLRLVYAAWVAVGTFVPHMRWMMWVTLVGLAANLTFHWCPLSRMLYLLPWNRREPWDATLLLRAFFSKPVPGRFHAPPPSPQTAG